MNSTSPHTPIQYIIGRTDFCGIDLAVDERVLIPRPETELAVETVARIVSRESGAAPGPEILDLCTGSGNIAISLMLLLGPLSMLRKAGEAGRGETLTKGITNCRIVASDISEDALDVARFNAARNGVSGMIEFVKSDLFTDVEGSFDIIVSNPPYIARTEFGALQKEVLREPRIALDGGDDGLDFYRNILSEGALYLKPNGRIVMEIGYGQLNGISDIIQKGGRFELAGIEKDWRGIDRVIVLNARKENAGQG